MTVAENLVALLPLLHDLSPEHPDAETVRAVLGEAERFAATQLAPSGALADRIGCRLEAGRVRLPACQHESWKAYLDQGWGGLAAPPAAGGEGLPLTIAIAVQMLFDAEDTALGMLALNQRCAARLLGKVAPDDIRSVWLPRIVSGGWGATICISEPEAGSDVGRIRTRAEPGPDGLIRISGQKCWISYGDHDLTEGIVHFVLARSPGLPAGTRGLSLFMVADRTEDGARNGVSVLRIEEKLGLHASPTCALAFDGAVATPLGVVGRGLPALFDMIVAMRLGVAAQGSGIAAAAAALAAGYAGTRLQGGRPDAPPLPIHLHAEVRRSVLELRLVADSMALLTLQAAAWVEAGDNGDAAAAARAAVLLPVAKALAAEAAFDSASRAIQVLGGAGYTRDFPAERWLRDSRIFSIYEGTTAIQARDLTQRQMLGAGQPAVLDVIDRLAPCALLRSRLDEAIAVLRGLPAAAQEQASLPFLRLFGLACIDGLLRRGDQPVHRALLLVHDQTLAARADLYAAGIASCDLDTPFDVLAGAQNG